MKPYYKDDYCTIYNADVMDVLSFVHYDCVITDPPYPNNAGWFDDSVDIAKSFLESQEVETLVFWNELELLKLSIPIVAVHIWHRSNVNGRPYEPIQHFHPDGKKRRSTVLSHAAVFDGVGPGCREYLGHPTQKPVNLMSILVNKTSGIVFDPFMGSGTTLRASKNLKRVCIGVDINEHYCEIAANRLTQEMLL